jgi:hypothetical protein
VALGLGRSAGAQLGRAAEAGDLGSGTSSSDDGAGGPEADSAAAVVGAPSRVVGGVLRRGRQAPGRRTARAAWYRAVRGRVRDRE